MFTFEPVVSNALKQTNKIFNFIISVKKLIVVNKYETT